MCLQFHRVWISLSQQCVWDGMPLLHNFASLFCFPRNYSNCLLYMENLQVFSALEDNTISNSFSLERVTVHSVENCLLLLLPKKDFPTASLTMTAVKIATDVKGSKWQLQTEERSMGAVQQSGSPGPSHSPLVQSLTQDPVGESGYSKGVKTQVEFRPGQTEALVTMILVREHLASTSPSAPLFFPEWLQRPAYILFQKKEIGEEKQSFKC